MNNISTKYIVLWLALLLTCVSAQAVETEEDRNVMQAQLDAVCEEARQKQILLARQKLVSECVEKEERPDRAACERLYADYGERTGAQQPLFYDLPECEKAHAYRTSYRQ